MKIKKQKAQKKHVIKIKFKFENYKNCLEATQKFKSEKHNVFTEEINKILLSSNDDRRIQSFDSIET